jgi:hypothetical protein
MPSAASGLNSSGIFARSVGIFAPVPVPCHIVLQAKGYDEIRLSTTVAFDRCSTPFLPGRLVYPQILVPPWYLREKRNE